ncbi:hypothetical protein IQ07DRAFT_582818, partial [Pyrenochaeta sp. DS3sAY3a]
MPQHEDLHPIQYEAQERSFFERLPYDIRLIIYEYLEPGDFAPFTRGYQPSTSGFLLSCRQAKQDFDDIAYLASLSLSKHLAKFTDSFKSSTKLDAKCTTSPDAPLRHITITLPFTAFDSFDPRCRKPTWKRAVLVGLHPLLSLYWDVVRIHFSGTDGQPPHESALDRGMVEVTMHSLLRDVTYMIERINKKKPGQDGAERGMVSGSSISRNAYPDAHVRAKRICLSWDLRNENGSDEKKSADTLNGKLYRDQTSDTGANSPETKAPSFFYHLRDEQRLAGEMGAVSETRWDLADDPGIVALLNCVDTRVQFCSSGGFGCELSEGLDGVGESEFEECEEELGALIY